MLTIRGGSTSFPCTHFDSTFLDPISTMWPLETSIVALDRIKPSPPPRLPRTWTGHPWRLALPLSRTSLSWPRPTPLTRKCSRPVLRNAGFEQLLLLLPPPIAARSIPQHPPSPTLPLSLLLPHLLILTVIVVLKLQAVRFARILNAHLF